MIIKTNVQDLENNKLELYMLVRSPAKNVKDIMDWEGKVVEWVVTSEGTEDSPKEILSFRFESGEIARTNSSTFRRSFMEIVEDFCEQPTIKIINGQSKNGRTFVDCILIGVD